MLTPNPFIYAKTYAADISSAPIPALLPEQYAQCGEDLIALACLRALEARGRLALGAAVCVEVGANHAFAGSNSYLVARELGLTTILVEPNPELLADLRKARPADIVVQAAIVATDDAEVDLTVSPHHELSSLHRSFVEAWHEGRVGVQSTVRVPAMRIDRLLEERVPPEASIAFLSIDIEGMDLAIARDLDFPRWHPCLVQLEPSEHFSPGEGARMIDFMGSRGYALLARTSVNLLFVDAALWVGDPSEAVRRLDLEAELRRVVSEREVDRASLASATDALRSLREDNDRLRAEIEAGRRDLDRLTREASRGWFARLLGREP